jgi:hypothetical protein
MGRSTPSDWVSTGGLVFGLCATVLDQLGREIDARRHLTKETARLLGDIGGLANQERVVLHDLEDEEIALVELQASPKHCRQDEPAALPKVDRVAIVGHSGSVPQL